jgi:hypothetical protein
MRSECGRVVGGCLACDRGVEGLGGYVSFTNGVNTQSVDRVGVMATQGHMTDELEKCGDYEVMCMFHLVLLSHDAATPTCLRGPLWEEKTQLQQEINKYMSSETPNVRRRKFAAFYPGSDLLSHLDFSVSNSPSSQLFQQSPKKKKLLGFHSTKDISITSHFTHQKGITTHRIKYLPPYP